MVITLVNTNIQILNTNGSSHSDHLGEHYGVSSDHYGNWTGRLVIVKK